MTTQTPLGLSRLNLDLPKAPTFAFIGADELTQEAEREESRVRFAADLVVVTGTACIATYRVIDQVDKDIVLRRVALEEREDS